MKTRLLPLLVFASASLFAREATPDALTVGICDFESKVEKGPGLGTQVAAMLIARLSAAHEFQRVEHAVFGEDMEGRPLEKPRDLTLDQVVAIGIVNGAKVLVTGRIFDVQDQTVIVAKITGVATGCVYGEIVKGAASTSLSDLSSQLADKISATITEEAKTFTFPANAADQHTPTAFGNYKGESLPIYDWGDILPQKFQKPGRTLDIEENRVPGKGVIAVVIDATGHLAGTAAVTTDKYSDPRFDVEAQTAVRNFFGVGLFQTVEKDGKPTSYILAIPVLGTGYGIFRGIRHDSDWPL
jgi:hypothetical protein